MLRSKAIKNSMKGKAFGRKATTKSMCDSNTKMIKNIKIFLLMIINIEPALNVEIGVKIMVMSTVLVVGII